MKPLILILLLCISTAGQTPEEKIKTFKNKDRFGVRYDRFKDRTHVSAGPFFVMGLSLQMSSTFYFDGATQKEPTKTVWLLFDSTSTDWRFLNNRELLAIIDGERMVLGEGLRSSKVNSPSRYSPNPRTTVSERVGYELSIEVFQKLANAKSVELKVGYLELKLKDEHLTAFRDFLSLQPTTTTNP